MTAPEEKSRMQRSQSGRLQPRLFRLAAPVASALLMPCAPALAADNPAEVLELPTIEVVGTTPIPGIGTPLKDVPANVQIYTSKDLSKQRQTSVTDYLEQNPTSVTINSAQGNPFQPDITFRGFTASPLLGTPQGLSVFQDGVRVNEPFGDVVNWDLIPQSAISSIQLIPGSNPTFGLNTLGGAIAIYTKSGSQYPGGAVEVSGGSFGRQTTQFEYGGKNGKFDYFLTGNYFDDRGWADHNPSRVKQFFGKLGWQDENNDVDVALTAVDNRLEGSQTLPVSFLDNIKQGYTFPDTNTNNLTFLTVKGSHFFSDRLLFGGNAYYRKYKNENVSSNVNADFGVVDPNTGVVDDVQATNDRSVIDQDSYGLGAQLTLTDDFMGKKNQFTVGASGDFGHVRFTQDAQEAQFTATRDTLGSGDFARVTDAKTMSRYLGVFATDTFNFDPLWALTLSGRYNQAEIRIEDQTGNAPLLNGDHTFRRFNPAIGINFNPNQRFTAYATYNEGMRAPTPVELTCADPGAPCKLPNNFLADPPLEKVVSKTFEIGGRGKFAQSATWSAAVYDTDLSNDIAFISSGAGASNSGFFANIGRTRRQGVELTAGTRLGNLSLAARYSYIDATFQSAFPENSPANSSADAAGNIQVRTGDRVPGIPQHSFKLRLDYDITPQWSAGTNLLVSSGMFARGDENNQDRNGKIPGYALLNLDTRYRIGADLEVFARVNNVFDRRYANFGVVGENFFTGPARTFGPAAGFDPQAEQFRSPGAPRGIWIGLRYAFGGAKPGQSDKD
jgi:iron complex outermembrane recepter protein